MLGLGEQSSAGDDLAAGIALAITVSLTRRIELTARGELIGGRAIDRRNRHDAAQSYPKIETVARAGTGAGKEASTKCALIRRKSDVCGRGSASALRSGVSPPDTHEQGRGPCTAIRIDRMAIYHLSADIVRRSAGRTVTAAAAYRAGELITDQRTGLAFDYRPRGGVLHAEIIAPDDAPAWMHDRARLWNGVEAGEKRKDAQLARDIEMALPHELTPVQRLDLVRGFVRAAFTGVGMVADIAIHAPCRRDADRRNHHAHILLTMRAIDIDKGGESFGPKVRAWNDVALLEQWRALWAEHVNRALDLSGESARVDHRSLEAQGIERVAGIHLGPAVVELAARGIDTERAELAREIEAINTALAEIEEPPPRASPPPATASPESSPDLGAEFSRAAREQTATPEIAADDLARRALRALWRLMCELITRRRARLISAEFFSAPAHRGLPVAAPLPSSAWRPWLFRGPVARP